MLKIPLKATPNQRLSVVLGDYNCTLKVYQRGDFLYLDLSVDNALVKAGVICYCDEPLVPPKGNAFNGLLYFADLLEQDGAPHYASLGTRYVLYYASPSELAEAAA